MSEILGSGLSFPLQVDHRGAIALASGEEDITQAIGLILSTAPGERPMRPEFGCEIHNSLFDTIDAETVAEMESAVRDALARWEPRIEVDRVVFDLSEVTEGRLTFTVHYRIRATNHKRNLVYPFYVIPAEPE
jgi:phage baseplate assembly protein W